MSATAASNSPPAAGAARADQLIDKQLSRVRRHIRIADLAAGGMLLLAGSLAYLLSVAVIDHWLYGLGYGGRLLALLGWLGGTAWFVGTRLVPAIWRPINPAFAAQTVERSEPALKNSLLNYLLLRRERAALHKVVLEALQYRAAVDLAHVEVEQTVDRTAMIHAGYVLVGVMLAAAAYKILSPKDPVQTVQRIVTPFADIARPARVSIEGIEPGDAEFYFGQTAPVRAVVRGVRSDETVRLVYSTLDGQTVDRVVPMQLDANGLHHVADLPPHDGLRQDVRYRVEAGDGVSRDYQLRVIAAPVIAVESVEYDFPAYTRRPREVVQELGDIKAVEGTRVTVRARANQPIRSATIEFQADRDRSATGGQPTPASEKLLMTSGGTAAERAFSLRMSADGRTPRYEQYSLTFVNTAGVPSVAPVVHRIDVVPDLAPEVEILNPERSRVEVAWHGQLKVEVRAIDPDYGLNQVLVRAVQGGTHVFERALLTTSGQTGQVVGSIEVRPADLGLEVGDEVTFWAVAEDNRMSPEKPAEPAPNTTRTEEFTFVVVADPARRPMGSPGDGAPQRREGDSSQRSGRDTKRRPERPDASSPAKDPPSPTDPDSAAKDPAANAKEPGAKDAQPKDAQPGAKSPEDGGGGEPGADPQPGAEGGSPSQPGQEGTAEQSSPGQGASSGTRSGDQTGAPSAGKGSGTPESPEGGSPASKRPGSAGSESAPGDRQAPPSGGAGQDASGSGSGGAAGEEQRTGGTAGRQDGEPSSGKDGEAGERSEPLHDGEVFEKALEHFRRKQQESNGAQPGEPSSDSSGSPQPESQGGTGAESTSRPDGGARPQNAGPPAAPSPSPSTSPQPGSDASKAPAPDATGKADPRGQPKRTPGKRQPDGNQGAGDQRNAETGEGGKSARGGLERPETDDKQPLRDAKSDQGQKQPGISDNGSSGDGEASRDTEGSGSVERIGRDPIRNVDTPKTGQPETNAPQDSSDPATTESQRQSDSKGGQSGDKSGGGKKGPGQGANQAGNDSAGQNSSSDDGAGQSTDSGPGDTASRPGQKQPSASPTGNTGDQAGPGSGSRPASPGQNASQPPGGSPPTGPQPPSATSGKTQQPGQGSGAPTGGGLPSNNRPSGSTDTSAAAEAPPGDAANLEFSRQATDMVLEQLRDQQDRPDRELLEKLGWSPEQLRAFVERWQKLKQHAQEDAGGQRELDESLRGLGLAPSVDTRRRGGTRTDAVRGLQESGSQSAPPSSYRDQFRAFKKGAARGNAP